MVAACVGSRPVVEALLTARSAVAATDANGATALHEAAAHGNGEVITALVAAGAPIDAITATTAGSQTGLHMAAFQGHLPAVQALLAAGADRVVLDAAGATAAEAAETSLCPEVARVLRGGGGAEQQGS